MIIAALNKYYQRLADKGEVLPDGFSKEKISYAIVLSEQGEAVDVLDIRDSSSKKPKPKMVAVPSPPKRTAGIKACFLWDKTSYVLGVSKEKKERAIKEHQAFKNVMLEALDNTEDIGLLALQKFLQSWSPENFTEPPFDDNQEILDSTSKIIFKIDDGKHEYLHDRQAAKSLWLSQGKGEKEAQGICVVSGETVPIARLHPPIKGVGGALVGGANIVSFNKDSFVSYNKKQGDNSPVSKQIADQYTKALNYLLSKETKRRFAIGDVTTVFWALADNSSSIDSAEGLLGVALNPSATDEQETGKLENLLDIISKGRPLKELDSDLDPNTEIFILGLSPNASRLSIRFWQTGTVEFFADKIAQHYRDLQLEPLPWKRPPSIWRLVTETAPSRNGKHKSEDVLPHLAGEIMRAIISGGNYPHSLLTTIIVRMRTDGDISSLRIALVKAVITRKMRINNNKKEMPVSLDKNCDNQGYQLGRWFAELENAQQSALGKDVKATIKDQYYGSASANPAATFPTLIRKYHNHISKLDRDKGGLAVVIEKNIGEIVDKLPSEFPNTLTIEDQGRFAIGYYHQRSLRFTKKENKK